MWKSTLQASRATASYINYQTWYFSCLKNSFGTIHTINLFSNIQKMYFYRNVPGISHIGILIRQCILHCCIFSKLHSAFWLFICATDFLICITLWFWTSWTDYILHVSTDYLLTVVQHVFNAVFFLNNCQKIIPCCLIKSRCLAYGLCVCDLPSGPVRPTGDGSEHPGWLPNNEDPPTSSRWDLFDIYSAENKSYITDVIWERELCFVSRSICCDHHFVTTLFYHD